MLPLKDDLIIGYIDILIPQPAEVPEIQSVAIEHKYEYVTRGGHRYIFYLVFLNSHICSIDMAISLLPPSGMVYLPFDTPKGYLSASI